MDRGARSAIPLAAAMVLLSIGLAGCLAGPVGPSAEYEGIPAQLAAHRDCPLRDDAGERLECETPYEEVPVQDGPGDLWVCTDGAVGGNYDVTVWRHLLTGQTGFQYAMPASDAHAGWFGVSVEDGAVHRFAFQGSASGFVVAPEPVAGPDDSVVVDGGMVHGDHWTNESALEGAEVSLEIVPYPDGAELSDEPQFLYWAIHRFDTEDDTFFFIGPGDVRYESLDLRHKSWTHNWYGETHLANGLSRTVEDAC